MTRSLSIRGMTGAVLVACLWAWEAPAQTVKIEPKAWDQAAVTQSAARLVPAVHELYRSLAARGSAQSEWGIGGRYHTFRNDMRILQHQAHSLQAHLEAGEGLEETKPIWVRIRTLVRSSRDAAQRGLVPKPVEERIEPVYKEVQTLAAFYGETTL